MVAESGARKFFLCGHDKPALADTKSVSRKSLKALIAMLVLLAWFDAASAFATDPEQNCAPRDRLVALLKGKPHYERQTLVLADEMPGQGHKFELFMNRGEGGRHSYTLIRTRRGGRRSCIVTTGQVRHSFTDKKRRTHLVLDDEGDPDGFDVIRREQYYVITRRFQEKKLRDYLLDSFGTEAPVVSFGRVVGDRTEKAPYEH